MKKLLKPVYLKLGKVFPSLYFTNIYRKAAKNIHSVAKPRNELFDEFINSCQDQKCLQIGVKDSIGNKFGTNWVSVENTISEILLITIMIFMI